MKERPLPDSSPASTVPAPRRTAGGHAREDTAEAPPQAAAGPITDDLDGIGDIVMAGAASGYAHLAARGTPTVGRLARAARTAVDALARPTLWPRRPGRWQPAPRSVRRGVSGRMRVGVVALEPNAFVELAAGRPHGGRIEAEVLALVSGQAHLVVTGPGGALLAVQELVGGRSRVLGTAGGHQLINTGTETLVAVRVGA